MPDQTEMPDTNEPGMAEEMRSEMEKGEQGEGDGTFFISPDNLPKDHECKPGDKLELTVVGTDSDGDYEVRLSGVNKKKAGLAEELRGAVNQPPTPETTDADATTY